jgi:hypothetical protein
MSFSSKGKKYPIGSWLFGLHFLLLVIIQAYFQESNLENSFAWLAGNISILLFGTILGFVSFKTDINCDYEPYTEGLYDFIVKKKYWWIWLFIFQILNCFVFQDIGNPNYYRYREKIFYLSTDWNIKHTYVRNLCPDSPLEKTIKNRKNALQ